MLCGPILSFVHNAYTGYFILSDLKKMAYALSELWEFLAFILVIRALSAPGWKP